MKIINLTCELNKNPVGIDSLNPRLAWNLVSEENGQKQTAYQIQVADSENGFDSPAIWETGKIESEESIQIKYSGASLQSATKYFWRVKVWDKDGNPTEFSDTASFETGLLDKEDWKAKWISLRRDKTHKPCPIFRKEISVGKNIKSARAYVSGLGYYELYINSKKVGDNTLDPGFTRYDKRALYVTYDELKINSGKNVIGIMLGQGWQNVYEDYVWEFFKAPWRGLPKFILQLKVDYEDGSEETFVSDETWKGTDGPIVYSCIRVGETYDEREEKDGWLLPGYDDNNWEKVVEAPAQEKLVSQVLPPIRERKTLSPVAENEISPGKYIYDFGQNFAGRARINIEGEKDTVVKIFYSELLGKDGDIDQSNINTFNIGEDWQVDTFILSGTSSGESFESRFNYHGFRYIQVTSTKKIKISKVEGAVINTDFKSAGSFECSNELFNAIQKATLESYNSNFHSYPTDCPSREKNGWTGDAQLAAEAGLFNFISESAYEKWMLDFADEQHDDGKIAAIIPTSGWGYDWGNGPAWDSAYPIIVWFLYVYRGNVDVIKKHYENLKKYIDFVTSKTNNRGIVIWGLGDWIPPYGEAADYTVPSATTSTSYYYYDTVLLSKMAKLLGKKDDEEKFINLAEKIKKDFNDLYYDEESGLYASASQSSQSCAIYQGLAENIEPVLEKLIALIKLQGDRLNVGILGYKWLMNCLSENGEHETAFNLANRKDFPSFGYWLENGATTLLEDWRGIASHNHIMFGDISAWFYKFLAGIKPDFDNPGFKKFFIEPMPAGDLSYVNAEHITPYGTIKVFWKIENGKFNLALEVPVNSSAVVKLPTTNSESVTVNGAQKNEKAFGLESGKYEISCQST